MFLENRVYQGSSGRVYPNAVIDRVSDEPVDRSWAAVHLENDYLRLMVLPEIGGRIHVAMDRTNNYDLFYRQNVIKPALVGLLGPWISGGVEFNWPQHHRPSTLMPVDVAIEDGPDGSSTVWCSEHEPMGRMKGMHGVTVRPGSSVIELRVRLSNRTPYIQTFLWWANAAARAGDSYQAFFPPDVRHVADHAKRAISSFPVADGTYYGIDYSSRSPTEADISWYRNIPVPTSYMVVRSTGDFFGGYDHAAEAGFVHWADHRISPGKKLWTWGNGDFGRAWNRQLTDGDGLYLELMAGVFSDNQPDFSVLRPYETKTFSQYWYPIQRIGPVQAATLEGALSLGVKGGQARIGVAVTSNRPGVTVRLMQGDDVVVERTVDLTPARPLVLEEISVAGGLAEHALSLSAHTEAGELVSYEAEVEQGDGPPQPASEPPLPDATELLEDLYLTGLHLAQYRHATRRPEDYWREALRRASGDSRSNTAMGWWYLRRGELEEAAARFGTAIATLTRLNPNPYEGEPFYGLGVALRSAGKLTLADEAFAKASWSEAWRGPADLARAQLAARRGDYPAALALLDRLVEGGSAKLAAQSLRAAVHRRTGRADLAARDVAAVLATDLFDAMALDQHRRLSGSSAALPGGPQTSLDVAFDYAAAGLFEEAARVLQCHLDEEGSPHIVTPMVRYTLAWVLRQAGDPGWRKELGRAVAVPPDYCFPSRLEDIEVLNMAIAENPLDARALYYLGNLLYDRQRYEEAVVAWRRSADLEPTFATVHRNLGMAAFNFEKRPQRALAAYRKSFRADPTDARVLYELDQLRKRCGHLPATRLKFLSRHRELVERRDDLSIEFVTLLNQLEDYEGALALLTARRFHPWEGGEGLVSAQWVLVNLRLAQLALSAAEPVSAAQWLEAALRRPDNLGEGKHLLTPENEIYYHLGLAHRAARRGKDAKESLKHAATVQGDGLAPPGEPSYWRALALQALGHEDSAVAILQELLKSARRRSRQPQNINYFATSLPTFLTFEDDLNLRNRIECRYLESLALAGLGQQTRAVRGFQEVTELDVNHARATWHLRALTM